MTDPRTVRRLPGEHAPWPPLPAVAVVDHALVARRRRSRTAVRRGAILVMAAGFALGFPVSTSFPPIARGVGVLLAAVGLLLAVWAGPWTGPRPGASWYLGIEADGLRLTHGLAAGGQVFLPWPAIASVRRRRYLGVTEYLDVRLRPDGGPWLYAFEPGVAAAARRRGFRIGLQGTSMSAAEAAAIIARVRP